MNPYFELTTSIVTLVQNLEGAAPETLTPEEYLMYVCAKEVVIMKAEILVPILNALKYHLDEFDEAVEVLDKLLAERE